MLGMKRILVRYSASRSTMVQDNALVWYTIDIFEGVKGSLKGRKVLVAFVKTKEAAFPSTVKTNMCLSKLEQHFMVISWSV